MMLHLSPVAFCLLAVLGGDSPARDDVSAYEAARVAQVLLRHKWMHLILEVESHVRQTDTGDALDTAV